MYIYTDAHAVAYTSTSTYARSVHLQSLYMQALHVHKQVTQVGGRAGWRAGERAGGDTCIYPVGRLSYGFVSFLFFNMLFQNFTGVLPEFHQKFTIISPEYRIGAP